MDKAKAKSAVKKSKSRKKSAPKEAAQMQMPPGVTPGINPEVGAMNVSMQPADGYINPYRALGTMVPSPYTPGNMLPGYNAPQMTGG
jgi:hypothetical protein